MSLTAGSVTVDPDTGAYSGSGLALAVFESLDSLTQASAADAGVDVDAALLVKMRKPNAQFAVALATPIVAHLVANAEIAVTVHTTDSGLQRVGGTPTDGPSSNKTLSGSLT